MNDMRGMQQAAQLNQYQYANQGKPALSPADAAEAMKLRAAAIKAHLAQADALKAELATIERMLAAMAVTP